MAHIMIPFLYSLRKWQSESCGTSQCPTALSHLSVAFGSALHRHTWMCEYKRKAGATQDHRLIRHPPLSVQTFDTLAFVHRLVYDCSAQVNLCHSLLELGIKHTHIRVALLQLFNQFSFATVSYIRWCLTRNQKQFYSRRFIGNPRDIVHFMNE